MYTRVSILRSGVRAESNEPTIDISFDCGPTPGNYKRSDAAASIHARIESVTGNVIRTCTGFVNVPGGMNLLCFNRRGTLIARTAANAPLVLIPPRSLTYMRNARIVLQAARGEHECTIISWQSGITPLLDHWIVTRQGNRSTNSSRVIATRAVDPDYREAVGRFQDALVSGSDMMEPLVVSYLYEVVTRLMSSSDQVQLAALPKELPETVRELVATVRQTPQMAWPLREAADAAGYSPFHFSRVFKSLAGYGFHEYVDRCRTECAVDMLCHTDNPVDVIANSCGFGTTQGLRESIREYLGLVPSELRALSDSFDYTGSPKGG